jgi:hypothetical protein
MCRVAVRRKDWAVPYEVQKYNLMMMCNLIEGGKQKASVENSIHGDGAATKKKKKDTRGDRCT